MADSYLTLARAVLEARARPLTAQEILSDARRFELLPRHLSGETMQKTLQARLAEDIFRRRKKSLFYRTAVGTYFLRSFANDKTLPPQTRQEYRSRVRGQPGPTGRVLFVRARVATDVATLLRPHEFCIEDAGTSYHDLDTPDLAGFSAITFTTIRFGSQYLVHQVGRYSMFKDEIGQHTIGVRRFVDEFDTDLFNTDPFGVELSARREVSRIVGSRSALWHPGTTFHQLGVVLQPESRAALFIFEASLAESRELPLVGRRLGISNPAWLSMRDIDHTQFDNTSALVLSALGYA
jgi:hypothetical protein